MALFVPNQTLYRIVHNITVFFRVQFFAILQKKKDCNNTVKGFFLNKKYHHIFKKEVMKLSKKLADFNIYLAIFQ
jgi:hypothetical protein